LVTVKIKGGTTWGETSEGKQGKNLVRSVMSGGNQKIQVGINKKKPKKGKREL